jgi:Ca2+-binding RTX toxin-like protein
MATYTGTNGNDTGIFGAVQPRIGGIDSLLAPPNPLNTASDLLYGLAGNDELFGRGGDDLLDGGSGADVMTGGDGNDTYRVDTVNDQTIEFFNEGNIDTVEIYDAPAGPKIVSYTLSANVENLTLSSSTAVSGFGNSSGNDLTGNDLSNILDGRAGADTMRGKGGGDTYIVDNLGDVIVELANQGIDDLQTSVSYTLQDNVENGLLVGAAATNLTGNSSSNSATLGNILTGNSAANTLDGKAGADRMIGRGGNDTYIVDNVGDVAIENSGQGVDTIETSVSYTLSSYVENGKLSATAGSINLMGNDLANTLTGNAASNRLDGRGGADRMEGQQGNDTYVVGFGDVVVEAVSQGTDTVETTLNTYTLGENVENLTFVDIDNATGYGNGWNNVIKGNSGSDNLFGYSGIDNLIGGAGDDALDGGSGNDALSGDAGNDILFGGTGRDVLSGGFGNDRLTGVSSAGVNRGLGEVDRLSGGSGADTFFFAANGQQFYNDGTITNGITDYGLVTDFSLAQGDRISLLTGQQYVLGDAIQLGTGIQGTSISMAFGNQANEVVGIIQGVNLGSGTFSSATNTNAAFIFS